MGFHVGQKIGDYTITALLGAGGMGRVYKVEHSLTRRTEAMKVLTAELATDTQSKRFEREMKVLARLRHPNIVALHNALHSAEQLIILMEFIEGETLESILGKGRISIQTAIGYIRQILRALEYAHKQGVVHRDVTPGNVIITAAGEVKLTDFGVSKTFSDPLLTTCGEILGALPYMAPEQVKGLTHPDLRSDLYSAGAILYEALTGQKAFGMDRRLSSVLMDSESEPQPPSQVEPSLSLQWDQIINRALARDPARRYQSAEEFLNALAQVEKAPRTQLIRRFLRMPVVRIALLAGLALALVASQGINRFRPVEAPAAPVMHILPPDFATSTAPGKTSDPTSRPHKRKALERPKRGVHSADTQQLAVDETEPDGPQVMPQKKRNFWSRFNVFKKKRKNSAVTNEVLQTSPDASITR